MTGLIVILGFSLPVLFAGTLTDWMPEKNNKLTTTPATEKSIAEDCMLPPDAELRLQPNSGTIQYLKGKKLSRPLSEKSPKSSQPEDIALAFIDFYKTIFKLQRPLDELRCTTDSTDELGLKHVRFQQVYKNIPVWGNGLNVHIDRDNSVYLVQGSYIPTPQISTRPLLSIESAIEKKLRSIETIENSKIADAVELVIYVDSAQNPILTYKVLLPGSIYFVDTANGTILEQIATYQSKKTTPVPYKW